MNMGQRRPLQVCLWFAIISQNIQQAKCQATTPSGPTLASGGKTTCAIATDGTVWCWGRNENGQLGDNTKNNSQIPVLVNGSQGPAVSVTVADVTKYLRETQPGVWTEIDAAGSFACLLNTTGGVWCWGNNLHGQLGQGDFVDRWAPVPVNLPEPAVAVDAGGRHACALLVSGTLKCWGFLSCGGCVTTCPERVNNTPVDAPRPEAPIASVEAGNDRTCYVLTNGAVQCWGQTMFGCPSEGDPAKLRTIVRYKAVAVTLFNNMGCILMQDSTIRCWGRVDFGGLQGVMDTISPRVLPQVKGAIQISTHCAVLVDGKLQCWGQNSVGQLGVGDTLKHRPSLVKVGPVARTVGTFLVTSEPLDQNCALLWNGKVKCWGSNRWLKDGTEYYTGSLGTNESVDRLLVPTEVVGLQVRVPSSTPTATTTTITGIASTSSARTNTSQTTAVVETTQDTDDTSGFFIRAGIALGGVVVVAAVLELLYCASRAEKHRKAQVKRQRKSGQEVIWFNQREKVVPEECFPSKEKGPAVEFPLNFELQEAEFSTDSKPRADVSRCEVQVCRKPAPDMALDMPWPEAAFGTDPEPRTDALRCEVQVCRQPALDMALDMPWLHEDFEDSNVEVVIATDSRMSSDAPHSPVEDASKMDNFLGLFGTFAAFTDISRAGAAASAEANAVDRARRRGDAQHCCSPQALTSASLGSALPRLPPSYCAPRAVPRKGADLEVLD